MISMRMLLLLFEQGNLLGFITDDESDDRPKGIFHNQHYDYINGNNEMLGRMRFIKNNERNRNPPDWILTTAHFIRFILRTNLS